MEFCEPKRLKSACSSEVFPLIFSAGSGANLLEAFGPRISEIRRNTIDESFELTKPRVDADTSAAAAAEENDVEFENYDDDDEEEEDFGEIALHLRR